MIQSTNHRISRKKIILYAFYIKRSTRLRKRSRKQNISKYCFPRFFQRKTIHRAEKLNILCKEFIKKRIRCDFIDMKAGLVYATKIHKTEIWRSYLSVILTRTTCPSVLCLQPECFQSSSIKISTFALHAMFLVRFPFSPQEMLPDFVCLKTFLTCRLFSERKYLISLIKNCRRK